MSCGTLCDYAMTFLQVLQISQYGIMKMFLLEVPPRGMASGDL